MAKKRSSSSAESKSPERIKKLESELGDSRKALDDVRKKLEDVTKAERSEKAARADLEKQLKQATAAREKAEADLAEQKKALQADVQKAEKERQSAEKNAEKDREAAVGKVEKEREKLESNLADVREELDAARKEVAAEKKRHQSDQVKALAERTDLENRLKEALASLEKSEATVAEQKKGVDAKLKDERKAHEAELKKLQKGREAAEKERAELADELNDLKEADKAFASEVKNAARSVDALKGVEPTPIAVFEALLKLIQDLAKKLKDSEQVEKELDKEKKKTEKAEKLEQKISDLIELNRKLQEQVDSAEADRDTLKDAVADAKGKIDEAVKKEQARAEKELGALRKDLDERTAEIASLIEQLQNDDRTPYLSANQVSRLIDGFYSQLAGNLTQLHVQDSEIRLKVGFAGISDEKSGVVVPTAENIKKLSEGLSEITIRLGRPTL